MYTNKDHLANAGTIQIQVEGHLEYRICAVALDPRHPLGVQCREYEKSLRPLLLQKVAEVILNSIIHCEVVICFI